ncbi:MAG: type 4a pilus biogenesis protein PilO [Candidatus Omnitrophica bacterium]|nr:type 4a pilus biogenesis protein PilO [Candidatus Omnitrophota bacterium]MDD5080298.1 type 4a pilus biogenesis protein PilO [Candidatus Omnitrophota bacterium]
MADILQEIRQDKQKLIAVFVAFGLIVILDCMFIIKAQLQNAGQAGAKVSRLKKDIAGVNKELTLAKSAVPGNSRGSKAGYKMYKEEDIPLLMEAISLYAKENNIKVMQITPVKETRSKEKLPSGEALGFRVKLNLNARYHKLGAFVNALEKSDHPVFVEEIKLSRSGNGPMLLDVNLTLKTYVKK